MDPKVVLAFTWILAGLVVAAYIWFVVWRVRVDRRKQETQGVADEAMSDAIARTARRLSSVTPEMPSAAASAPPGPSGQSAPTASSAPANPSDRSTMSSGLPTSGPSLLGRRSEATVADLVSGIALPSDLVPLTTIAPRAAVGDRVAFWTDRAPAEVVGPAFAAELERLGFTMIPLDERTASAQRADDRLVVTIHPDGSKALVAGRLAFTSVPENSVVIEVWVPA